MLHLRYSIHVHPDHLRFHLLFRLLVHPLFLVVLVPVKSQSTPLVAKAAGSLVQTPILGTFPQICMTFLFEFIPGCFRATSKQDQIDRIVSAAKTHLLIDILKGIIEQFTC